MGVSQSETLRPVSVSLNFHDAPSVEDPVARTRTDG